MVKWCQIAPVVWILREMFENLPFPQMVGPQKGGLLSNLPHEPHSLDRNTQSPDLLRTYYYGNTPSVYDVGEVDKKDLSTVK
jgi:hypothetical protein